MLRCLRRRAWVVAVDPPSSALIADSKVFPLNGKVPAVPTHDGGSGSYEAFDLRAQVKPVVLEQIAASLDSTPDWPSRSDTQIKLDW